MAKRYFAWSVKQISMSVDIFMELVQKTRKEFSSFGRGNCLEYPSILGIKLNKQNEKQQKISIYIRWFGQSVRMDWSSWEALFAFGPLFGARLGLFVSYLPPLDECWGSWSGSCTPPHVGWPIFIVVVCSFRGDFWDFGNMGIQFKYLWFFKELFIKYSSFGAKRYNHLIEILTFSSETSRDFRLLPTTRSSSSSSTILLLARRENDREKHDN